MRREFVRNHDESRLPADQDDEGRVAHSACEVVNAHLMLPAGSTSDDVKAIMERMFEAEPTLLHWSTNWFVT